MSSFLLSLSLLQGKKETIKKRERKKEVTEREGKRRGERENYRGQQKAGRLRTVLGI